MKKELTQFKAVLDMPRIRFNYDPQMSKVLKDGTIVSNKGDGFKYSIKLVNGETYSFDLSDETQAFMVKNLGDKLVEVGKLEAEILKEVEIDNISAINDDSSENEKGSKVSKVTVKPEAEKEKQKKPAKKTKIESHVGNEDEKIKESKDNK